MTKHDHLINFSILETLFVTSPQMKGGPAEVWQKLKKQKKLFQTKYATYKHTHIPTTYPHRCVSLGVVKQWKRGSKPKPRGFCIGEMNPSLEEIGEDTS